MWLTYIFGMHWKHGGELYYDDLPAVSIVGATDYFVDHNRDDIDLVRVELIGPDEPGTREYAHSPSSPFDPLVTRRRVDREDNAR